MTENFYMSVGVEDYGSCKKSLASLKLELQSVVNCPEWMLRTELGFSAKAISTHNHRVISPAPEILNNSYDLYIQDHKVRSYSINPI